jgi:hypothetical protein
VWEDELGPNTLPKGPIAKINLLKETVAKLQLLIGKIAVGDISPAVSVAPRFFLV